MPARAQSPETISVADARRLFMHAQGMLDDPERPAHKADLCSTIDQIGFVQIDTINVVERAHHLTLATRLFDYEHETLRALHEDDRFLFEHWTHDASLIPTSNFHHWKHRFEKYKGRGHSHDRWWAKRIGHDADEIIAHVLERITNEGSLRSADFEHQGDRQEWWGWKPQKAALEYLWRCGDIAVSRRENFHKFYDLTERVLPDQHLLPASSEEEYVDWACRSAFQRLIFATPGDIARFWRAIDPRQARLWCDQAASDGAIVPVTLAASNGKTQSRMLAVSDWQERLSDCPDPPVDTRLVNPFDPLLRDRKRTQQLFNFDFRFEGFVPEAKRQYGYFVLGILEGDQFIGRLDPKFDRPNKTLIVRGLWWEPKIRITKKRRQAVEDAIERLAEFVGAEYWDTAPGIK